LGVVFSTFFALGVILIEKTGARSIDLDANCVLYGQLEALFWIPPEQLFSLHTFSALPEEVLTSFVVLILTILTIYLFYKELLIATFDPSLGNSLGYSSSIIHYGLGFFVAIAVVISFKAVGSILVISMLICPAATGRLLTDKLTNQLIISGVVAFLNCIIGYLVATQGIKILGYNTTVSAAGMMTVVSGCTLSLTIRLAPRYGIIGRRLRQHKLAVQITAEDMLGALVRAQESAESTSFSLAPSPITEARLRHLSANNFIGWRALRMLKKNGNIRKDQNQVISLTPKGATKGRAVVRSHRLWEVYLYQLVGIRPDHVHSVAERLEHFTAKDMVNLLEKEGGQSVSDPHGKKIPQE
jgi:manganese/zinc/iron transport system permease protein